MKKRPVGYFGSSANPTTNGHMFVALDVMRRMKLEMLWFLVTPGNPLKDSDSYISRGHRMALANLAALESGAINQGVIVSDFEMGFFKTSESAETINSIRAFEKRYADLQPVWIMGADNFAEMHTWGGEWKNILIDFPVIVLSRATNPGDIMQCKAAQEFAAHKVDPTDFTYRPGQWCMIEGIDHPGSATEVRQALKNGQVPKYFSYTGHRYALKHNIFNCRTIWKEKNGHDPIV